MNFLRRLFGQRPKTQLMRAGSLYPGLTLKLSWLEEDKVERVVLHSGDKVTVHLARCGQEELDRNDEVEVIRARP